MILPLLLVFQQAKAEDARRLFAVGSAGAVYLAPPEPASGPYVRRFAWSGDGTTLFAVRLVPPPGALPLAAAAARQVDDLEGIEALRPRVEVVAWDRRRSTARTRLTLDSATANVLRLDPMAASDAALLTLKEGQQIAFVLLTGSGTLVRLWSGPSPVPNDAPLPVVLSALLPIGVVRQGNRAAFFGADGALGPSVALPTGGEAGFAGDGGPAVTIREPDGKRGESTFRLDPRTGARGGTTDRYADKEETPPAMVAGAEKSGVVTLTLAGAKPGAVGIVTTDGISPLLSPKNDAVAYLSGHSLFVRAILPLKRDEYDRAMRAAAKARALSYAKQVGTALSTYAADADDALPPAGSNIPVSAGPYARNLEALRSFTYTFAGGVPPKGGGPSEIGFVPGPGGQAVVYSDGSVTWRPDAP